jgi:adenosylcobinamide-phosphate synthase
VSPFALLAAVALDFMLGDPRWLPHPVRWIGKLIAGAEKVLYPKKQSSRSEFLAGLLLCSLVVLVSAGCAYLLLAVCGHLSPVLLFVGQTIIAFYCLSARSLTHEAIKVRKNLESGDLPGARKAVSMIVGRDTECLDEKGVIRATIETVAENITDGIVPRFFTLHWAARLRRLPSRPSAPWIR